MNTLYKIAVLVSPARHPVSGQALRSSSDAAALELACSLTAPEQLTVLYAGNAGADELRDYLGLGAPRIEVLRVPDDTDVVPALLDRSARLRCRHLRRPLGRPVCIRPAAVSAGGRLEHAAGGRCSGCDIARRHAELAPVLAERLAAASGSNCAGACWRCIRAHARPASLPMRAQSAGASRKASARVRPAWPALHGVSSRSRGVRARSRPRWCKAAIAVCRAPSAAIAARVAVKSLNREMLSKKRKSC